MRVFYKCIDFEEVLSYSNKEARVANKQVAQSMEQFFIHHIAISNGQNQ